MSNTMTFHGRLVADARTGSTPSGTSVCNFKVASDVGYGDNKRTNYVECALWGKRAEGGLVEYLKKGTAVYVSGELTINEPREHKGKYYNDITLRVNDLDLIGGKREASSSEPTEPRVEPQLNDEIPF